MSIDDYEVLNILGSNINSSTYKVKQKESEKLYVWKNVVCGDLSNGDKELLLDKVEKRISIHHPHLMKFHNCINQEIGKIYVVIEYCENGSLKDMIDSCLANNTHFSEELVCRILYQIAFSLKTIESYAWDLTVKEVFLDNNFNVRLINFNFDYKNDVNKDLRMNHLGILLYEVCTLKTFNKNNFSKELKQIENNFSHSLVSLISRLIKDKNQIKNNLNNVLCHPTVLIKSAHWLKEKSFIDNENSEESILDIQISNNHDITAPPPLTLERLRSKEAALQVREQKLNEWEYKLNLKERKVAVMERTVKEKLQQAELYLKRCRESKSTSSEGSKYTTSTRSQEKKSYENLDSTYVSCGDSILLPTSSKLNVNKIKKPAPFTRTLSERRIRFKGHSPLKDMDFNKRKSVRHSKLENKSLTKNATDFAIHSEKSENYNLGEKLRDTHHTNIKQLFTSRNVYENDISKDVLCKPIGWTEESKKYAFELLRMMNIDKENHCVQMKHTYL